MLLPWERSDPPKGSPPGRAPPQAVRGGNAPQILHRTPLCAQTLFHSPKRGFINFFFPKKKKLQKEVGERAARPHPRTSYRPKKFRPHLTQEPSVQMCCPRGITNSPNHRFFPTECVRQNPNLITRPAPRAPYGHRRGLCVGASVRIRNLFHSVVRWLVPAAGAKRPLAFPSGEGGSQRETDEGG